MTGMIGYKFAGFTFWSLVRAVETPDGKVFNPSPVLCNLLLALVKNPSCDLSTEELIAKSGSPVNILKDTFHHQIIELRKFIEEDYHRPKIIKTIKGFGYRLNAEVSAVELVDKDRLSVINQSHYADRDLEIKDLKRQIQALKNLDILIMLASLENPERASKVFNIVQWTSKRLSGGPDQESQISTLEMIADHIQDAFSHYRQTSSNQELELAVLLSRFWLIQGCWFEGCNILQAAISRHSEVASDAQAMGLAWLSYLFCCQGSYISAEQTALQAKVVSQQIGNDEAYALSLHTLGAVAVANTDFRQAKSLFLRCLRIARQSSIDWLICSTLRRLGINSRDQALYIDAEQWFLESLRKREAIKDSYGIALIQTSLSEIACEKRDLEQAKLWIDKSMESQHKEVLAGSYASLGLTEEASGQHRAAFDNYQKSLLLRKEIGSKRGQARAIEGMAKAAYLQGDEKESAGLFGSADKIRTVISAPLSPAERNSYGELSRSLQKKYFREFEKGSERLSEILKS